MHLMVLGASRLRADHLQSVWKLVSMHLMVLGASRLVVDTNWRIWIHWSQCTWWCWVLPDPLGVLSVVPPGETGPGSPPARKRPLDRAAHRSLNQDLPSSRKGRHRRASRGSAPPDVDAAMRIRRPCRALPIPVCRRGPRTGKPWLADRRAGGGGHRPRTGRPRCSPVQWGDDGPAAGAVVAGDGGGGLLGAAVTGGTGW